MDGLTIIDQLRLEAPPEMGIGNPIGADVFLLSNGVVAVVSDAGESIGFSPAEITKMMPFFMASMLGEPS